MTDVTPQAPPPAKKGMGALGWILIGCGGILLVGLIGVGACTYWVKKKATGFLEEAQSNPEMAAAKFAIGLNPDLEIVSTDDAAGTLTIHNKKTGETVTLSMADIKEGKFSMTTDSGTSSVDMNSGGISVTDDKGQTSTFEVGKPVAAPSWVPTYPNGSVEGAYSSDTSEVHTATFVLKTSDSVADVLAFYEENLKANGMRADTTTYTANGAAGGTVTASNADNSRTVSIAAGTTDGSGTAATITYVEKK